MTYRTKKEIFFEAWGEYVLTEDFANILLRLDAINPKVSELLDSRGIGTKLLEDGSYDWESGQLLDDMDLAQTDLTESELSLIQDAAYGYEFYVKQQLEESDRD